MSLLLLIHKTYERSFRHMLVETSHLLSTDLSLKNLTNAVNMISNSTTVHQEIENVLSFSTFLAYVLVFVNFLHLVSLNISDLICPYIKFRIAASVIIFLWTLSSFVKLTATGAKIIDACETWKLLQKSITINCAQKEHTLDQLMHLLLFLEVTKIDLSFTGWGMFKLDKRLIMTMAEAIITYSVLIVTL
ncbi:uncharacterized protein TNIN_427561 [Trichonephila inaurata madagascariensis]|uniref:Gustatory receptor n=1 Tax=Trichonephila inaurata madagascariensis TaxID=2747483 RepID=A0A8X6IME2_9ARAC|nr:uncharacterized protein TNIN_427561 [Trichonephila inaurata madagascariensis]